MTLYEIMIVGGVALGFAMIRFGLPLIVTWGIGRVITMISRPAA